MSGISKIFQIWVCRSVGFPFLTGCRGGAPAPKRSAGGVGGGLERPDARGSARRFPIEKLLQNITNSITTRKFSCTFRCAPRRSRPPSGLPAPVFEAGGFAPSPPLQRKPNRPTNPNLNPQKGVEPCTTPSKPPPLTPPSSINFSSFARYVIFKGKA